MKKIFSTYRHLRMSIIIASQYPYVIQPQLRECLNYTAVFDCSTKRTISALFESFFMNKFDNVQEFQKTIKELKKYEFLFFNKKENKLVITKTENVNENEFLIKF